MPELPEVEALAAFLSANAVGRFVARIDPVAINVLKTFDPPFSVLHGQQITGVRRHGKFLDLCVGAPPDDATAVHFVLHLARAGWLRWKAAQPSLPPKPGRGPLALRLTLDDGSGFDLTEQGTQKRLAVYVVRSPDEVPGVARLGADPLAEAFTVDAFARLLAGVRAQIKGVLTDQTMLAGVGNAYSDEALWAARLSPFKIAASLTPVEVGRLFDGLTGTLRDAAERSRGLATAELKGEKKGGLAVHGQTGLPCRRCGDTVREVSYADKSLQYCPTCQTGGKPLADRRLSRLLK